MIKKSTRVSIGKELTENTNKFTMTNMKKIKEALNSLMVANEERKEMIGKKITDQTWNIISQEEIRSLEKKDVLIRSIYQIVKGKEELNKEELEKISAKLEEMKEINQEISNWAKTRYESLRTKKEQENKEREQELVELPEEDKYQEHRKRTRRIIESAKQRIAELIEEEKQSAEKLKEDFVQLISLFQLGEK